MRGVVGRCASDPAFCLMPVHGGYCGGGDPSGEPFEAEVDVVDFRGCCPCGECHVWAEAPSAVGERAEAADEVVVCVFGFAGEFASEFGEDVAGAGGELGDCGRVSACKAGCDDCCPPFGFHFVSLSLFVDDFCRTVVDCPVGQY